MWKAIGLISSGLTLVAFIVATAAMVFRRRLLSRERELKETPEKDRARVIEAIADSFSIPSLPIDPAPLSEENKYRLLLRQLQDRSRRYYVTSIMVLVLALIIASLTVVAILKSQGEPPQAKVPVDNPPRPISSIERTYRFAGPFKVARNGDVLTYNLTDADQDDKFSNRSIQIEHVICTAEVTNESDEPFGFDEELLIFPQNLAPRPHLIPGTGIQEFSQLTNSYSPPRRLMQIVLRTDAGRAVHSSTPITWSLDTSERVPTAGELKNFYDAPITLGPDGLFVQMLLWTAWSGEHFIEFSNVQLTLKIKTTSMK